MTKEEPRYHHLDRDYEGEGIVVHWDPSLCIHTARCIQSLPQVFDPHARPWVDVTKAEADAIAEAVRKCPTGALTYRRTDGAPQEPAESPPTVQPRTNGPLFVRGAIQVLDAEGNVQRTVTRAAFCRCGGSANKPFCDNTHRLIGFIT